MEFRFHKDPDTGLPHIATHGVSEQEVVDAICRSVLSISHNYVSCRMLELLREKGAEDIAVFGGGIIPAEDIASLKALGVKELFTPGTSTQDIVRFVRDNIRAAV